MKLFSDKEQIHPEDVEQFNDFTVPGKGETKSMATMQTEGVAALYNILCEGPVAYLADEVGMGKTYQALGLTSIVWNLKPAARILFISPRQNLQEKWIDDYKNFFASNYLRSSETGDDRVTSVLFKEPIHPPRAFENLRSWVPTLGMPERVAPFLRHSSFTRPVYLRGADLEKGDLDQLWSDWQGRFKKWSIHDARKPNSLTTVNASHKLNLAFASALNKKLQSEGSKNDPYFDLVVVDEAQCLRNPENQTNQVLKTILTGQVAKWLFMSATPAHSSPTDIPIVVNNYCGEDVLDKELAETSTDRTLKLQQALQAFMVRRPRRYHSANDKNLVDKSVYRNHDQEGWAVRDSDMTTLSTLSMGLIQKGLVDILERRNNRYRIGFLSSFESLQSSLRKSISPQESDSGSDFHETPADGQEAPDSEFISKLDNDFREKFDLALPHGKVESVVKRVAPYAFGSENEVGGRKCLIFTRRISTVQTLRNELTKQYILALEKRVSRYWKISQIDWDGIVDKCDESDTGNDVPDSETHQVYADDREVNEFRKASAEGGWLHRYRQTFRGSGRNSLVFEDGWLERLCRAGGRDPEKVAREIPDELYRESYSHASKGGRQAQAKRIRYLAVQGVRRFPEKFGLSRDNAKPWKEVYELSLSGHLAVPQSTDDGPHRAEELFSWPTIWSKWDKTFLNTDLALPAADPTCIVKLDYQKGRDLLCKRQVARTILGQVFRLTDTLLDIYFADESVDRQSKGLSDRFIEWLTSGDLGAKQLQVDCTNWLEHLRLVVDSCLNGAGKPWNELVRDREETWLELYEPHAVVGITGGTGGNRRAIKQFRTPSIPRVIVCTDTLKEGVDLHLFCDQMLHYGVAWTSGDMEQRIGRVDRYFSQIERRLTTEGASKVNLQVGYPHIFSSLERDQVERVVKRQKEVETLMDSPLAGSRDDQTEFQTDRVVAQRSSNSVAQPFENLRFPSLNKRGKIVVIEPSELCRVRDHYFDWYRRVFCCKLQAQGWHIEVDGASSEGIHIPVRHAQIVNSRKSQQYEIDWCFDAALERYVITLASAEVEEGSFEGGKRKREVGKDVQIQEFVRLLPPTLKEGIDESVVIALIETLGGESSKPSGDARMYWQHTLNSLSLDGVKWKSDHEANVWIKRGSRNQKVEVRMFDRSLRCESKISHVDRLKTQIYEEDSRSKRLSIDDWCLETNYELPLGYFDVDESGNLVFGIHVLHGNLTESSRLRLIKEVGWRADVWEARLTGVDEQ